MSLTEDIKLIISIQFFHLPTVLQTYYSKESVLILC